MKNLSLFVSAVAILSASSAFAAIDCGTLPSCESLGYNDIVAQCPKSSDGKDMVVKCPFDTSKGKCLFEAAVGEIAYFPKAPNANSGWLLCDGTSKSRTQYPQLAAWLDTTFCSNSYHLSTACPSTGGTFAVPNYKGYFLRVYGTPHSDKGKVGYTDLKTPQKEGLPNITGETQFSDSWRQKNTDSVSYTKFVGAFVRKYGKGWADGGGNNLTGITSLADGVLYVGFSASDSNSIYGSSTGVTPPNIAVYAYIYAGKVVK